ncbi:hypothetical protein BIY24_02920 [Halobacteriovorax marinus]|uniref:glycosyltransferase family 4 protein n=1 Tax=Halobacteriovorax marinus TaxID=97084 RepID=UPI000BC3170B|nr:glycosyltransferase family 4 protein [Halobacteriovorax marinus]ATH06923.1 hypothetical protein BIY24_02920 [Halobacteriovorax marinus]
MANIYRDQQNILYVCLGSKWGTRERMALKDCLIARETGHNVFLYCLRDSFINLKAKQLGIDCLFHVGSISLNFLKWHRLNAFVQYLTKFNITLVHCYDISFLWPASFYLKRKPKVSLVFTFNHEIKKFYKRFWHRNLIRRIDQVFLPVKEMADGVHGHLEVPIRKFEYTGLGVGKNVTSQASDKSSGAWFIGCAVGGHEKEIDFLKPAISAISSLNTKSSLTKKVKLLIYSEVSWDKFLLQDEVREFIAAVSANDHVFLEFTDDLTSACQKVDAWLGLDTKIPIEDLLINSLLNDTPTLAPRTYATKELFRKRGRLGETYKSGDAREIREKIEKILSTYTDYITRIERGRGGLISDFGFEFYKNQLLMGYQKILTKRERLIRNRPYKSV